MTASLPCRRPRSATAPSTVNGLRLHLAEAGPADGPVVLLHSFPECWCSWGQQLTALAAAGFHAVPPDQRGYARSGTFEDRPR